MDMLEAGRFRRFGTGEDVLIPRSDVLEQKNLLLGADQIKLDPERLLLIEARLQRIEGTLNLLFEVLNLGKNRFAKIPEQTLRDLHAKASMLEREKIWLPGTMIEQAQVFVRLHEVDLVHLNLALDIKDSWRPFLNLCLKMLRHLRTRDLTTSLELQRAQALLLTGRDNLRLCAALLIEREHYADSSASLLAQVAAEDLDAFDTLVRRRCDEQRIRRERHLQLLQPAKTTRFQR
jgi:hypothetical protein